MMNDENEDEQNVAFLLAQNKFTHGRTHLCGIFLLYNWVYTIFCVRLPVFPARSVRSVVPAGRGGARGVFSSAPFTFGQCLFYTFLLYKYYI